MSELRQLKELVEQSEGYDLLKHDHVVGPRDVRFDEAARAVVPPDMGELGMPPMSPTPHAYRQLFKRLGPSVFGEGSRKTLPFDYLTAISPELLAHNLNTHLDGYSRDLVLRGYDSQLRAVVSKHYACTPNSDLLRFTVEAIEPEAAKLPDLKVVRPVVTPDNVYLKIVWRNGGPGGNYGIGALIKNDEIGRGSIGVAPLVQVHGCTNSIVIQHEDAITFTHKGDPRSLLFEIKSKLLNILPISAKWLKRLLEAEAEKLPSFSDVLDGLADEYGWSDALKTTIGIGTRGQETQAGVVAGVTYAAHAHESIDQDTRADLEALGGYLLAAPTSLFGRAAKRAAQKRAGLTDDELVPVAVAAPQQSIRLPFAREQEGEEGSEL